MKQNDKPRPAIQTKEYSYYLKYPPKEPSRDKFDYAFVILASILVIGFPFGFFYKQNDYIILGI